jgi:hypothetical protein
MGERLLPAQFLPEMTAAELSDITNGLWLWLWLWLCRNCHKQIDNDPLRFPPELLFEWRRLHETAVVARIGRPGDQLRQRISMGWVDFQLASTGSITSRNEKRLKSASRVQMREMPCSRMRIAVCVSWTRFPAMYGNSDMTASATSACRSV